MIALPPPPMPVEEVRGIDFEIQAPDASAPALQSLIVELFGIKLNEKERLLTIKPSFPSSWIEHDASISTSDFDFSCTWNNHQCVWDFEGFGAYAERYDSIVVYAPEGIIMAGELADNEGVTICYLAGSSNNVAENDVVEEERYLTRKERKALAKKEKERKKREKAEARKKK